MTASTGKKRVAWPKGLPPEQCHPPLQRAPEKIRTIFTVTMFAACLPLAAGITFFGWRAAWVAILSVGSCVAIEKLYFRVTHTPALLGRSHAYLTGVLLALTLPAFTPWYVVIVASVFAIIVGKAIFGGVGHFLWQPALVGRFAVAVIFPTLGMPLLLQPANWPVLAQEHIFMGDVNKTQQVNPLSYDGWSAQRTQPDSNGFAMPHPAKTLFGLTDISEHTVPAYSSIAQVRRDIPNRKPAAISQLPPLSDMLLGVRPGGIGETSIIAIIVAGLYLVYRNYIKWQLPFAILASAAVVAAIAPIRITGPNDTSELVYFPLLAEGLDVGFTYVNYQILSGGLVLAAFFLAPEMTSRPVTTGGQVLFGIGCGTIAMLLKLYLDTTISAYIAVLAMNSLTPTIDAIWRPRVMGQKHLWWFTPKRKRQGY